MTIPSINLIRDSGVTIIIEEGDIVTVALEESFVLVMTPSVVISPPSRGLLLSTVKPTRTP